MTISSPSNKQQDINYFGALDIGSNSFHFVLARQVHQQVQIVYSEKYKVKLASGLDKNNKLSNDAIMRGIATLASIRSSTSHLTSNNFRAVATFTLRKAENADEFLSIAKQVFPFDIEVISGHEEARLIYNGVNYYSHSTQQRLVIDIGGGSTECIIGQQENIHALTSLTFGCVSYSKMFFADDKITKKQFSHAITAAKKEIYSIVKRYKKHGWQEVIGTSGTIKAIYQIVNHHNETKQPITLKHLHALQTELIAFKDIESIKIAGLKAERNSVICAGVVILTALIESLDISEINYCKYALREGVLSEQLSQNKQNDTRIRTVNSLAKRFNADMNQVEHVNTTAQHIFNKTKHIWKFKKTIYQELLNAAVQLHEIGFDINYSNYHKHGEYILSHSDLAGFNDEQQQALVWLVGNQRKNIADSPKKQWHVLDAGLLLRLLAILRLSIILNQQRLLTIEHLPLVYTDHKTVNFKFDIQWLAERPLIDKALVNELQILAKHGLDINIQYQ